MERKEDKGLRKTSLLNEVTPHLETSLTFVGAPKRVTIPETIGELVEGLGVIPPASGLRTEAIQSE